MNKWCVTKLWLAVGIMAGFGATPGIASAAFFQLVENSGSGLGNANAGAAATAEDASTVWYNPAGLTRLTKAQTIVAGHYIVPSTDYTVNSASRTNGALPAITGSNSGDAGESAFVPNFYYSRPMSDRMVFGFGVTAPFGLATDYEDDWRGRYHADRSEIKTVNVNPALGYRVNDQLSMGFGLNYQMIEAELTQAVDVTALAGVAQPDGHASVTADDSALGYNFGFLFDLTPSTRLGLAHRSKLDYSLTGNFDFTADPTTNGVVLTNITNAGVRDSGAVASVELPGTWSLSVFHRLDPKWALMADITRTRWSSLPELRIDFDSNQPDSVVTLGLEDANRYSLGTTYSPGGAWTYRAGIALDETPVPNPEVRTPRLPDADRLWLTLGANYRLSQSTILDVAFVHIKLDDADVNKVATGTNEDARRGNLNASYQGNVSIFSVQGSWSF